MFFVDDPTPTFISRDFYVYLHKTPDGAPFYIGKGRGLRAYSKYDKGKGWCDVVDEAGSFEVEILRVGMTEEEALIFERDKIIEYGRRCDGTGPLVNVNLVMKPKPWRHYYVVEDEKEILDKLFPEDAAESE